MRTVKAVLLRILHMKRWLALFFTITTADSWAAPTERPAALAQALTQQGRWLIDSQHRVVLIHGGNVSQLVGDAHLPGSEADRGPWQVDTHLVESNRPGVPDLLALAATPTFRR